MRALCISWKRYVPYGGGSYRVMWEAWLRNFPLWAKEVDKFYLIDQDFNFTEDDEKRLKAILPNSVILKSESQDHHWAQFKWVIPQIKEDSILFLDNDVVITKAGVIDGWFKSLKGNDLVASFDGSGGLREQVQAKFPFMKETRMGSPYFLTTKKLLNKIEIDFEPKQYIAGTYIPELDYMTVEGDWSDAFGLFTIRVLGIGAKIIQIPDPRDSIYLTNEGTILREPETPMNLGYYHIRNGNLANYILTSKTCGNMNDYQREISGNKREVLRSLAWFVWMGGDRDTLVEDLGRNAWEWANYMNEFKRFHNL